MCETKLCVYCGTAFKPKGPHDGRSLYCKRKCKALARAKKAAGGCMERFFREMDREILEMSEW